MFNEYHNWLEINESNYTIHGRKFVLFLYAVINVENIQKAFGFG